MTDYAIGWVARDRAARFREDHPDGPIEDWKEFATDLGMHLVWMDLNQERRAVRMGKLIILQTGMGERAEQEAVRHEISHYLLHSCNMSWWKGKPCGHLILSKYERQANELAALLS